MKVFWAIGSVSTATALLSNCRAARNLYLSKKGLQSGAALIATSPAKVIAGAHLTMPSDSGAPAPIVFNLIDLSGRIAVSG